MLAEDANDTSIRSLIEEVAREHAKDEDEAETGSRVMLMLRPSHGGDGTGPPK